MDLVSPLFPGAFVTILCIGSMARSVSKLTSASRISYFARCSLLKLESVVNAAGVASGATRAALTQHFALRKNAADVSAKVIARQLEVSTRTICHHSCIAFEDPFLVKSTSSLSMRILI